MHYGLNRLEMFEMYIDRVFREVVQYRHGSPREPSALEKYMIPLHQMPAANPDPERLDDETSVKTIQPKVNNKVDPAMPVHHTPSRVVSCGPRPTEPCR